MIISHKHRFIFLHVPKTGGSSIKAFLSQYIGDDDILNGWNHSLKKGIFYNLKLLKMINNDFGLKMISKAINLRIKDRKILERPILEYAFREILKKKIGTSSMHATANQIRKFDKKSWDKYFKFAFVRNPYTHAISHWLFDEKKWSINNQNKKNNINLKNLSEKKFVNYLKNFKKETKDKKSFYHASRPFNKIYTTKGKIAVDYVGKFESLKKDFNKIKKILNLPKSKFDFPHEKKNITKNYLYLYNNESKKLVEEIWEKEFEFFNYKFPKSGK